jgi:glycosyltransferase involved in cell wall biosynthesis
VPIACTAVAGGRPALARVLADGLRRVHPEWRLVVLLLDGDPPEAGGEPFDVVGVNALGLREPGLLELLARGPRALGVALRPALMAHLAEQGGGPVVWLDPTLRVLGPLDRLVEAGRRGLALVPLHARRERLAGLAARGPFESGVVAGDDPDLLRWWAELTTDEARAAGATFDPLADHALGAVLGVSAQVRVLRDRALCAGWWTLAAGGRVTGDPVELDGERLSAFNVAGFDPARPHWLSGETGADGVRVSESPALAVLLESHAEALLAAGWERDAGRWSYRELPGGVAIDDDLRDLVALARRGGVELGHPFTEQGAGALLDWIDSESPIGGGVTWMLERVHRRRPDLQVAFPDLAGGDGQRLVAWMRGHGEREEPLLAKLLERRTTAAPAVRQGSSAEGDASVRVVGYLEDGLGLGEAARSYVRSLTAAGVDVESVSVPAPIDRSTDSGRPRSRRKVSWDAGSVGTRDPAVEIVCMNPPELLRAAQAGTARPDGSYRIGVWAWELDTMPADWAAAFPLVDELWVYSDYVAEALRPNAPVPVNVAPLAVDLPPSLPVAPESGEPFTFLFVFDLFSSVERKNPLGLIAAYRSAFEPGDGARLLLKTSGGADRPDQLERIRLAAGGRDDVEIVDEFVSEAERDALIAGCDCYVSLHRAEGFGLTLAEAMAAARPVVATAFSGNLDFMTDDTAYLVGWRLATVQAGSELYPEGARWAEPDVEQAAGLLRAVYDDPAAARARGVAAREHVAKVLSRTAVGAGLRDRLEQLEAEPAPASRRGGGGIKRVLRGLRA